MTTLRIRARRFAAVLIVLGLTLAACGQLGGAPLSEEASPSATQAEPGPTGTPAPSVSPSIPGVAAITGVLSGSDLEGGCVWLSAGDVNYEVIWPDGWSVNPGSLELTDPDGGVVATGGDRITVHGQVSSNRVSICQVGPIFEAVEVEIGG